MIADVITPEIFAPNASPKTKESGFSLLTIFCATFAVVGTQLTAAIPITGLQFPLFIKYIIYPPKMPPIPDNNKAAIPKTSNFNILGSSSR